MIDGEPPLSCLQYLDELRLEKGGVVRAVLDLSSVLAESGVSVTLLTGDTTDAPAEWLEGNREGLPRVELISRFGRSAQQKASLDDRVRSADVVHLHTPWDPFNPIVAAAARRAAKPYVVTAHGMLDDWCLRSSRLKKAVYLGLVGRRLLERASAVHYTASIEQEQSQPRAPLSRPVVLPLVVDLAPFQQLPGEALARETFPTVFSDDAARLLFVGRLHPIKGLDLLLEAFAAARPEGLSPRLLLAGPYEESYRRTLESIARRSGCEDRVHFLGMVHGDVKHALYQSCDAFVLPSHHENFGIALAEAMICGAPALLTRSVNIWPEIQSLGGLVVDRSVEGLRQGIERVALERDQLRQQGLERRGEVLEWLNPDRLAREYRSVYHEAIASAPESR